jgi:hypothetical protein
VGADDGAADAGGAGGDGGVTSLAATAGDRGAAAADDDDGAGAASPPVAGEGLGTVSAGGPLKLDLLVQRLFFVFDAAMQVWRGLLERHASVFYPPPSASGT